MNTAICSDGFDPLDTIVTSLVWHIAIVLIQFEEQNLPYSHQQFIESIRIQCMGFDNA